VGGGGAGVAVGVTACARERRGRTKAIENASTTTKTQNFRAGGRMGVTGITEAMMRVEDFSGNRRTGTVCSCVWLGFQASLLGIELDETDLHLYNILYAVSL